ncbi:hypothetical protein NB640_10300 [Oxalobacter vibrioformis]|uniref:Uncharacterized protein n=1 Tax=Oxalobacter vibrioformis TaxID=933080 RepID=A0A9E9P284_9BURK|nr:STM3941 family protein [Oxalobacter vibrioformis]WAW09614.1 hypothetical protein NB640_10300 [Oxalobacter vibrioformis]
MDELVVRQKSSKQIKLVVYAIILVAASVFCVLQPGKTSGIIRIIGIAGGVFFSLCLVLLLVQLAHPRVLMVINASGISGDFSGALSTGLIPWQSVAGFGVTAMIGQRFISVDVNDVDAFLATLPAWKEKAVRANMALGHPLFSFPMQTADHTVDEVLEAMGRFYAAARAGFGG